MSNYVIENLISDVKLANEAKRTLDSNHSLSPAEVAKLEALVKKGAHAIDMIIINNVKLVSYVASDYKNKGVPFEDLMQEGKMGLLTAIEKYDPSRGTQFSTCAVQWIRNSISRAVANTGRSVRLPDNVYKRTNQYKRVYAELEQKLSRCPSVDELAEELNTDPMEVLNLMDYAKPVNSLDCSVGDSEETTFSDLVADNSSLSPEEKAIKNKVCETIYSMLKTVLNAKEIFAVYSYYGLDGTAKLNYEEIGKELHVSSERARQLVSNSIKKLQNSENINELRELMFKSK